MRHRCGRGHLRRLPLPFGKLLTSPSCAFRYTLIGFFGIVVSLVVTLGAANVAGETKKSFMASAVFVAYCVGNIVGPQLVKSETKAQHYPELWIGLIIWCVASLPTSGVC